MDGSENPDKDYKDIPVNNEETDQPENEAPQDNNVPSATDNVYLNQEVAVNEESNAHSGQRLSKRNKNDENLPKWKIALNYILDYIIRGGTGAIAMDEITMTSILVNCLPNIINYFIYYFAVLLYAHFCGKYEAGGYSLLTVYTSAQTYIYDFYYYLAYGFVLGIAIIGPAKFGLKKYRDIGVIINIARSFIIFLFIIYIIFTFTVCKEFTVWIVKKQYDMDSYTPEKREYVEELIGYFADEVESYSKYTLVGYFFEGLFEIECAYSKSHLRYGPNLHGILTSFIGTVLFSWIFIDKLQNKIEDAVLRAAIAFDITSFFKFLVVLLENIFFNPYPESLFFLNKEVFNKSIFKLTMKVCSLTMIVSFAESVGFSFSHFFLMATNLDMYEVYVVLLDVYNIIYPIINGTASGTVLVIAYLFGEKNKVGIKKAFKYILALVYILIVPLWILFMIFNKGVTKFFTSYPEIYDLKTIIWYFAMNFITALVDASQAVLSGTLRGLDYMLLLSFISISLFCGMMTLTTWLFLNKAEWGVGGVMVSEFTWYCAYNIILMCLMIFQVDLDKSIALLEKRETLRRTRQIEGEEVPGAEDKKVEMENIEEKQQASDL